jgi:hypothetical protein
MGQVIAFPIRVSAAPADEHAVDLFTAVDVAIRELRDIARDCPDAPSREQADYCRQMLDRAFRAALAVGITDGADSA